MNILKLFGCILIILSAVGCSALQPTQSSTPTLSLPTFVPTLTPPTSTPILPPPPLTPTPTFTPTPTVTFMPTSTPTPTPAPVIHLENAAQMRQVAELNTNALPHQIVYSPDGNQIAVATDKGIYLYDAKTLQKIRTISALNLLASSLAFSPDGSMLVSGSNNGYSAYLFDPNTGAELGGFGGYTTYVNSVAFSPDGRTLVLGAHSYDERVQLWDVDSGKELFKIVIHKKFVNSVTFSPDGKMLASASEDNTIRIWNPSTGVQRRSMMHKAGVNSVVFSPDGKMLASGSDDYTIRLWDPGTGKLLRTIEGDSGGKNLILSSNSTIINDIPYAGVLSVAFSPDGQILASGDGEHYQGYIGADGRVEMKITYENIRLWDIKSGVLLCELGNFTSPVLGVAFSPDGRTLASLSGDGNVQIWQVR